MKNKTGGKLKNYRWLQYSAVGMIAGASIGVGAFYIADAAKTNDSPSFHYGVAKSAKVFNSVDLEMHETNPGAKEENKTFFLSELGLNEFVQMIKDRLDFGPEFFDLNKISIDDKNLISSDANGNYYPKYDTINLSSEQFRSQGLPALKKGETDSVNDRKIKEELLFEVFFHEYGHFLANKYLEGYSASGKVSGWNKNFEDGFEHLLHYDDTTAKPMISHVPHQSWQSMGSVYSAADIYDRVNFDHNYSFPEVEGKTWFPVWAGTHPFFNTTNKAAVQVDTSKLQYLWSLEELFTRKYQQVLMTPNTFGDQNEWDAKGINNVITKEGFHYFRTEDGDETNNIIPYAYDTTIYKDLPWLDAGSKLISGSDISFKGYINAGISNSINPGGQYMADDPMLVKTEMKNLLKPHLGIDKEVSAIYFDKDKKLHIGGFTNSNNIKVKIGDITFDGETHQTKYWSSDSMWVSAPIDANKFLHKKIEIIIDGKAHDLKDIRSGETGGTISTHRTLIKHEDYHLSYNTNKSGDTVTIEKGAGI